MSDKLKTVEEHKRDRYQQTPGSASGVACPQCGKELYYFLASGVSWPGKPPGRGCFCRACGEETILP